MASHHYNTHDAALGIRSSSIRIGIVKSDVHLISIGDMCVLSDYARANDNSSGVNINRQLPFKAITRS